jgi:cell division protein FtsQ
MTAIVEDEAQRPSIDPRLRQRRIDVRRQEGRRRLRRLLIALAGIATLVLLWSLTYSSLVDVDRVVVQGAGHTTVADIRAAAAIGRGQPMAYLDTRGAAHRIEALPWVASARVQRDLPGTVRITVVERVAVAASPLEGGGWRLLDSEGHALGDVSGLPAGVLAMNGPDEPVAVGQVAGEHQLAALQATAVLPQPLKQRVGAVVWAEDGTIDLQLAPAGTIRLGLPSDLPAKYLAAISVLDELGPEATIGVLDVRAPEAPVLSPG